MDMDDEVERGKGCAKVVLMGGALLIGSLVAVYQEAAYLFNGRDTTATIEKVYATRGDRLRGARDRLAVDYYFTEPDGTHRRDNVVVSQDWPVPADGKIRVRYTPGADGSSRLVGHVKWWAVGLFGAACLAATVAGVWGYRAASAAAKDLKRR